jgi:hypothetical protein
LGEESEAYRLVLTGTGFERVIDLSRPNHVYTVGQQSEDGWTGPLLVSVMQVGTYASSEAARISFG